MLRARACALSLFCGEGSDDGASAAARGALRRWPCLVPFAFCPALCHSHSSCCSRRALGPALGPVCEPRECVRAGVERGKECFFACVRVLCLQVGSARLYVCAVLLIVVVCCVCVCVCECPMVQKREEGPSPLRREGEGEEEEEEASPSPSWSLFAFEGKRLLDRPTHTDTTQHQTRAPLRTQAVVEYSSSIKVLKHSARARA